MKKGAVLVEALIGALALQMAFLFLFQLSLQLWAKSYVQSESYFLARAQLYHNPMNCRASELIAQDFIARAPNCAQSTVNLYKLRLLASWMESPPATIRVRLAAP